MQVLDFLLELLVVVAFQVHRALAPEAQGGTTKVSGSQTSYFKDTLRL